MSKKITLATAAAAVSLSLLGLPAGAQNYQTFAEISYQHVDDNSYALVAQHYFDSIENHGPLDEFDYILATSNVYGAYGNGDLFDTYILGGEAYLGRLLIGAQIDRIEADSDSFDANHFTLGYLLSKDLLVKAEYFSPDEGDSATALSVRYNYQLQGDDYIGSELSYVDEDNQLSISSKYFTALGDGRYLALGITAEKSDAFSAEYGLGGNYYFNAMTSVGANYNKGGDYGVSFKHFFNKNIAIEATYEDVKDFDEDIWTVSLSGSF